MLELDFIGYKDKELHCQHRQGFDPIASSRWYRFLAQAMTKLSNVGKTVIMLCDREADFFEFLDYINLTSCHFVIRSKYDRAVGIQARSCKQRVSDLLANAPDLGHVTLPVVNINTHQDEFKTFHLKSVSNIQIPPSFRGSGHRQNKLSPIYINAVQAYCGGCQTLTLFTDLPVLSLEQCLFVLNAYKKRWHIESFHKVLKTAYKAEQIYLHSSRHAIQNLLTIINIAASRTYNLIHQARHRQDELAINFFDKHEIDALDLYLSKNDTIKQLNQCLHQFYIKIAMLGGYKNFNNKHPPGILTIYRGIKKLKEITKMYKICLSITT